MPLTRNEEIRRMATRSREGILLAAIVGIITGLAVAFFDRLVIDVALEGLFSLPLAARVVLPVIGLAVSSIILKIGKAESPATSDEYISNFHDREDLSVRSAPARIAASIATLGTGGPMGLEGPAIYIGSVIGTGLQARFRRIFGPGQAKALMVAGAAAGVAAIFKAPATGAVFALEVPYRDDVGRRLLIPALVGAASGYLAFVALNGTTPLLSSGGAAPFDFRDLLGASLLGIGTGLVTRGFAYMLRQAKKIQRTVATWQAVLGGGAVIALVQLVGWNQTGEDIALGPGYAAIKWAAEPKIALWLIVLVLMLRSIGTAAAVGAGGVGGLFVPLVVLGSLFGQIIGTVLDSPNPTLFALVGVAAALGAGYRVPLAGVMFVAEASGRPGFIVPGLLAAVGADLVMGSASVTPYQQSGDEVSEYH